MSRTYIGPAQLHFEDGSILRVEVRLWEGKDGLEGEVVSDHDRVAFSGLVFNHNFTLEYGRDASLEVFFPDPISGCFKSGRIDGAT